MQENMEQTAILPDETPKTEGEKDNESTVSVGKFANSEELLKAYNSLQSEFTKKCQQLKELEARCETPSAQNGADGSAPLYEKDEWDDKVAAFIEEYPIAKEYASEISILIKGDPELAKDERCLDIALGRAVAKSYKKPESIIEDGDFLEKYVYSNEQIRDKVIEDYLRELSPLSSAPKTIPHGGSAAIIPPSRARSIEEAGAMAEKMINARRI